MRVAFGLALLAVLAGALMVVGQREPRLAGTNNVFDSSPLVQVPAGGEACAPAETVPGDTAAVRVHATPDGGEGGALDLRVEHDGRVVARGSLAAGWREGHLDVPLRPHIERTLGDAAVCFRNRGTGAVALWGYSTPDQGNRTVIEGEPQPVRVRLTYLRPSRERGWEVAGAVARRMGHVRGSLLEGWAFYGWVVALLGTGVVAAVALLRRPTA